MNRPFEVLSPLAAIAAAAFGLFLSGCDKAWELGQKLKAPEAPEITVPEPIASAPAEGEPPPPPEPENVEPLFNPDVQVSILGYHDFSATRRSSDMVIHPDRVRQQMEVLKKSNIPVTSMSDYLAWKRGEKKLPDPCVVITCDDGWEGVYTDAFPIFKEYGYPFSIYIYRNYIGGSGRSLAIEEIREMMAHGCEIGSHSVSHADLTRKPKDKEYDQWLQEELVGSLEFLRATFGVENVLPVFAYPYGKYNTQIVELCKNYGYELGITVAPKKAAHGEPNLEVGRFIIHGDDDTNFNYAMSFKGAIPVASGNLLSAPEGEQVVALWPEDQEVIASRLPRIQVDLSQIEGLEPSSMSMRVSGFGEVPASYDAKTGLLHYQVSEPLRAERCQVTVRLQRRGQAKADYIKWAFQIDLQQLYFPEEDASETPTTGDAEVTGAGSAG